MSRDLRLYLENILASIIKIEAYIADTKTLEAFIQDGKTFDAVVMNLQVIGESVKQIPDHLRMTYHQIAWKSIAGLRDIISHTYDLLEEEIIWDAVHNELPQLYECIKQIQSDLL
ncbi:MAG: HepT-like ribonuclease domain-containing protein [Cyanobacteria bacterium J06627_28]